MSSARFAVAASPSRRAWRLPAAGRSASPPTAAVLPAAQSCTARVRGERRGIGGRGRQEGQGRQGGRGRQGGQGRRGRRGGKSLCPHPPSPPRPPSLPCPPSPPCPRGPATNGTWRLATAPSTAFFTIARQTPGSSTPSSIEP